MKKLMLCGVAAGVVFAAAPAMAQIDVTIGGHTKNYMGWLDQDETAGNEVRSFDMLRESELHINAEGTADNGLTYGFHIETEVDGGDGSEVEESYLYLSSGWGRVNLGSEDGANYLLQVEAPSADSNIDGLRQYIQPIRFSAAGLTDGNVDYANDASGFSEKVTYLSPVWNGFQVGGSYTPEIGGDDTSGVVGFALDDQEDDLGSAWEGAVRYEGTFNNIGFATGAGYTHIDVESNDPLVGTDSDDVDQWNVGLDLDMGAFGLGAVYTETEGGVVVNDFDAETIVVGADYTTGPFQFGGSYFNRDIDGGTEMDRYTGGVIYTAAPGLSFRGSVSFSDIDVPAADDFDATSVLGGIQLNF